MLVTFSSHTRHVTIRRQYGVPDTTDDATLSIYNENSSGDEIANVNFYAVRQEAE